MVSVPARLHPGIASTRGRSALKAIRRSIKAARAAVHPAITNVGFKHEPTSHDQWVLLCTMAMLTSGWERVLSDRRRQP